MRSDFRPSVRKITSTRASSGAARHCILAHDSPALPVRLSLRITLSSLGRVFDTLRSEAWRASESLALIEQAAELWIGESPLTAIATAERA